MQSKWITTPEYVSLTPINVFHKEWDAAPFGKTPDEINNTHCRFRKTFTLTEKGKYTIDISADDYYKLYINGRFVCQGPASGYAEHYTYNHTDITSYLQDGENVIAVDVFYQGLINRVWNSGDNRQGLVCDVCRDGTFLFGTDESWKYVYAKEYVSGGVASNHNTQFLENIDFRLAEPDWNTLTYDESRCLPAVINENDDHILTDCAPCLSVYTVFPASVKTLGAGHLFIDFGKEYTGQIHFTAKGSCGDTVTLHFGEELNEDGSVRYDLRCNCHYEEICTLSGREDEFLFYDYMAFRYAEIICSSADTVLSDIDMIVRHCPFDESGFRFASNNPLLNDIWAICAQALKIGTQDYYLDCPSREKGQYLGDFLVTGNAHMYLTGNSSLYRRTLFDFALSAKVCDGLLACAPGAYMQEIADYSLQYPYDVLLYYRYTGDKETVRELMPCMDNLAAYFKKSARADGLLEAALEKWNIVDWPANLRDDYDMNLTNPATDPRCHNVINAYYYICLKSIEEMKDAVGIPYTPEADAVGKAYVAAFYDPGQKLFVDHEDSTHTALHSNVLAALAGLVPEEAKEPVRALIMEKGLCCGVWFSYFVLKALASLGAYEDEYRLIVNESIHSWANMLREGATTSFEAWGKDQKWNTSLCHPWASSPIIAMIEDIVGIAPESFHTGVLQVSPHIPAGLTVDLLLPCQNGTLHYTSPAVSD